MKNTFDNSRLDIIVPIKMEADWPTAEDLIQTLRYQKEHYGIHRFMLAGPSLGWRTTTFPPLSHFEDRARLFVKVRDAVKDEGISCGYLNMLTMRCGESFSHVVRSDGTEAPASACPLDPDYQKAYAESNARFVEIAHPDFIMFEDDYSVNAQSKNGLGCFCERHLQAFAERCGRYYSREELVEIFQQRTPEAIALLRKWRELVRDSMVILSSAVRTEVDKYDPSVPIGTMQPSASDQDGNSIEHVARALAGPNHVPFVRIYGVNYCEMSNAKNVPDVLCHTLYVKQHFEGEVCCYHESDTYPHNRFYNSARRMRTYMGSAYSMGFDGSTFQTPQVLDDKNEEKAYGLMYKKECERFNAASRAAKQCRLQGVEVCFDPFYNTIDPGNKNPFWTRSITQFSIPYTTLESPVAFWDRRQAKYADHETVMKYLSKGLFLDAAAAKLLCERGYGRYLGVEIGGVATIGWNVNDECAREIILPPFDCYSTGKHMHAAEVYCGGRNGTSMEIKVTDPKVETITELCSFRKEVKCPGMVRFENELGGRIVVLGQTIEKNLSQSLLNYRRQHLFHALIKWCSDSYVYVENEPNIFVIMNEAVDPESAGFKGMLTLSNLGEDTVDPVVLHLPPQWQGIASLKKLDANAQWVPAKWEKDGDRLILSEPLHLCDPMYLIAE